MKVAILGSRGIPACYSGYDTLVEELSFGLACSGDFDVLVYCRSAYYEDHPDTLQGVRLVYLPAPRLKALESLLHSFISTLHVLGRRVDVVYFVDPANAPFCLLLRLFRKSVIVHTDGLGWKRRKWGPLARRYYKFVERLCAYTAAALVTDNPVMQEYYWEEYNAQSVYIPYGAEHHDGADETVYKELDLSPNRYLLVVARLEPENNTDFIVNEYTRSKVKMPLVVVGDSPYNPKYLARLHELADDRTHFVGRINNQRMLNALYKGAYLYIHGHEVGGTNPSLLRAMNAGSAPLVIDVPFNKTVIEKSGFVFKRENGHLSSMLEYLVTDPTGVMNKGLIAQKRAEISFTWDLVVEEHKKLFRHVTDVKRDALQKLNNFPATEKRG